MYTQPGEFIVRFFQEGSSLTPSAFLDSVANMRQRWPECVRQQFVGSLDPRLTNCLCYRTGRYGSPAAVNAVEITSPDAIDRWKLAMVFHLLYSLEYALPFGEEVGLIHEGPPWYPEPMWWADLPNPEAEKQAYRGDFFALVQSMNALRSRFAPLRHGDFKPVLADDQRKLLAFSRSLRNQDVIVAMNCGEAGEQVQLKVGTPGMPVELLTPQLTSMQTEGNSGPCEALTDLAHVPGLRVDAEQVLAGAKGEINIWVEPKGVRLVVVNHKDPQ